MAVYEAAFVGALTALGVVSVVGAVIWAGRRYQARLLRDHDDVDSTIVTYERPLPVSRRRIRWGGGENSGTSAKGYSEINKGPDRPARSRPAGKVGMVNQSNRLTSDWRTDHITSRAAGRKDAHKVTKKRPARKPKPR